MGEGVSIQASRKQRLDMSVVTISQQHLEAAKHKAGRKLSFDAVAALTPSENDLLNFEATPKLLKLINGGVKISGGELSNLPKLVNVPPFIIGFRVLILSHFLDTKRFAVLFC